MTVAIVFYAALFPMLLNTWTGVRAVNPLWLRAAQAHGRRRARAVLEGDHPRRLAADHHRPAPGLHSVVDRGGRRRDARGVRLGAGWIIFDAKEFLNADVMLASLAVIGAIGYVFERFVFGSLERFTVLRWGMVRAAKT